MYMYNLDKDELICKSCPVYGTEPGKHTSSHPLAAVHCCMHSTASGFFNQAAEPSSAGMQECPATKRGML